MPVRSAEVLTQTAAETDDPFWMDDLEVHSRRSSKQQQQPPPTFSQSSAATAYQPAATSYHPATTAYHPVANFAHYLDDMDDLFVPPPHPAAKKSKRDTVITYL